MPRNPDPDRGGRKPAPKKKPASRRNPVTKDESAVSAEHRRLLEAQEELKREQERLQRLIKRAPAREAALKKKQREPIRINVSSAGTMPRGGGGLRSKYASERDVPVRKRARRAERNLQRVQFLVLCLILLSIVFAIWRVIP